jgi:hypothetical protein
LEKQSFFPENGRFFPKFSKSSPNCHVISRAGHRGFEEVPMGSSRRRVQPELFTTAPWQGGGGGSPAEAQEFAHVAVHVPAQILHTRPNAVRANYGPAKRDIFCRPTDPKYIFIDLDDEVESDSMEKAFSMKPTLIVETSENKFQVWYKTQAATTSQENKAAWSSYVNAVLGVATPEQQGTHS